MKNLLLICFITLIGVSLAKADTTVKVDIPGTYLGGTTASGIDCQGTQGVCFSKYIRVKTPPAQPSTGPMAVFVTATNDGVCDIDGINTTTNPTTGNTHSTIQTNSNSFSVNNIQDLLDWMDTQ